MELGAFSVSLAAKDIEASKRFCEKLGFTVLGLGFVAAVAAATSLTTRPLLSAEPQFRFQNNIWVNLHHFLRGEARRRSLGQPPALALSGLSEADRAAWTAALEAYSDLAKRNLIFDERLVRINNALASQEDADALPANLVEPGARTALNRASSIYRKSMWAEHRRINDEWIGRVRPLVEQHAPALIQALTDAYHVRWPTGPIIVDASNEAGPNLAYTTDGPEGAAAHTTIASTRDAEIDVAFETVFHEASHSVDSQIIRFVDEEGAKQRVKPPPDLWHGIIFFTVGELVKRELHRDNDPRYQPYAYRFGVYDRGWQTIRMALERDWQPYLDGKVDFGRAMAMLVADCVQ